MNRQYLGTKYRMNVDMHEKSSKSYANIFNGVTPLYIHCAVPSQVKSACICYNHDESFKQDNGV